MSAATRTEAFEVHRRLLFAVAYEMLGSAVDAEDVVQESWLQWANVDRSDVHQPRGVPDLHRDAAGAQPDANALAPP